MSETNNFSVQSTQWKKKKRDKTSLLDNSHHLSSPSRHWYISVKMNGNQNSGCGVGGRRSRRSCSLAPPGPRPTCSRGRSYRRSSASELTVMAVTENPQEALGSWPGSTRRRRAVWSPPEWWCLPQDFRTLRGPWHTFILRTQGLSWACS